MDTLGKKVGLFLIILSTSTLTVSAADWSFEESKGTVSNVSANATWIFTGKLYTQDGDELTPERLPFYPDDYDENKYINGSYTNKTGVYSGKLAYSEPLETWITFGSTRNIEDFIFEAQGVSDPEFQDSNGRATLDFNVSQGNHTVELEDGPSFFDISNPYEVPAGSEQRIAVNVSSDGEFDQNANVTAYVHNHTYKSDEMTLSEIDTGSEIHYGNINVPDNPNSTYMLRIQTENENTGDYGSYSSIMKTSPEINMNVAEFTSVGCDSSGVADSCEPSTEISTEVEISGAEATSVNVSTWITNKSNSKLVRVENTSLSRDGNLFTGEVEMPDINKSSYEKMATFRFNASNSNSNTVQDITVNVESYNLDFDGSNTGFIGSNYELAFAAEKAYSGDNYNMTRFDDINGTVSRPGSFELDFVEEDFSYDESSGLIVSEFEVPEEASTGIHDVEFNFTDIYNETKSVSDTFRVNEFDQNFEVLEGLEVDVNKLHEVNRSLEVRNNGGASLDIRVNLSEEFDGVVNMSDSFSLEPEETKMVNYTINLSEPEDIEGDINLTESSGYSIEETFEINAPNCEIRNESLCVDTDEIDFGTVEGNTTEELTVYNLHAPEMDLNASVEGNISDHLDFTNSTSFNDSETMPLVFEPNLRGKFTGILSLETETESVEVNLTAVSNITEVGDSDLSISPSEVTVTVPEGLMGTAEFTAGNIGEVEITDITVELENGEADTETFDLSPGNTNEFMVELNESDTLTLTGDTPGGEVSSQASISVDQIDNYEDRSSEIEDRVRELRDNNDIPISIDSDLTDVTAQAENVRTQWENGNYEQARETFEEAQTTLDELENEIDSQQTETPDTPDQDQNQTDEGGDEEESGGLPIIPIIAILAVLLLVGGFIFFESYIPEEGDPLYGVFN